MKMFMIVSAEDNLKHWFPIDRIVRISEQNVDTWHSVGGTNMKNYTAMSSITILDEDGCCTTIRCHEKAEDMVERLEIVCKLP